MMHRLKPYWQALLDIFKYQIATKILIAPLLGFGMLISLTEGFYIPTFISSVIKSTPLYLIGVTMLLTVFLVVGIANLYVLHGVVLDKLSLKEAGLQSKKLMKVHWKDYLKQNFLYILVTAVLLAAVVAIFIMLPMKIVYTLPLQDQLSAGVYITFITEQKGDLS